MIIQAENLHHDSMEQMILDNLSTAVLVINDDLIITYLNPAAESLLAVSAKRLCGSSAEFFFANSEINWRALHRALLHSRPFTERKVSIILPDHSQIIVDYSVTPTQLPSGRVILVEIQAMDRLIRINKEEALASAHTTSKNVIRGLAHEVKNPLGGIHGAAQLLASELENSAPDLIEYTEIISSEVERLSNLVDRMLGPNKPGRMTLLNIHAVTEQVATLVIAETQGELEIERDYDPSIPEVFGDKEQLIQALLNVVRNAMHALKDANLLDKGGKITLRTRIQTHFTIGKRHHKMVCKLEIVDNGPGVPPEIVERLFYPMISGRPDGTGLGLSITQSVINLHNGLIECDSKEGQTTFTIFLPIESNYE